MQLLGFAGFVFPLGNIIAPLSLWLIKRSDSPLLDRTGKEVLNFQISYLIYTSVASILLFVVIGFVLLPLIFLFWLVFIIIAAIQTSHGEEYRYPMIIRLVS